MAHTGFLQRCSQGSFELRKPSGQQHLKIRVALLQQGCRLGQRGHQVTQLLGARGRQQQQHRRFRIQTQLTAGAGAIGQVLEAVQQGMAHPAHIRTAGGIELGLCREDRQDPVGEVQQTGGAAIAKAPGPLLGSDVIRDRQLRLLAPQPCAQAHIGPDVVDQHHPIKGLFLQKRIHPGLQPQRGKNQRNGLPKADGPHRCGVGDQHRTRRLHARATQGQHLQLKPPPFRLQPQGANQQAALQITGDLPGADQQPNHQRPCTGIGPRRP